MTSATGPDDVWRDWLLRGRFTDDAAFGQVVRDGISYFVRRVLENGNPQPDQALLDIGTGDGLVALSAIDKVGPSLRVICADRSHALLWHAEKLSVLRGVRRQCTFFECDLDCPLPLFDAAVDVITSRSCIAYLDDKPAVFRELFRTLKPGGRLSIAEPIYRDDALSAATLRKLMSDFPSAPEHKRFSALHRWKSAQFPDTVEEIARTPWANFSERDLLAAVQAAGFINVHLELKIDIVAYPTQSWRSFLAIRPLPWAASLEEVLATRCNGEERDGFLNFFHAGFKAGEFPMVERMVYIWADKPS